MSATTSRKPFFVPKHKRLHFGLTLAADISAFLGAILVIVSILAVNTEHLHRIQNPKKEADALVDALDLQKKLTIAGLLFLVLGMGIRIVLLRFI